MYHEYDFLHAPFSSARVSTMEDGVPEDRTDFLPNNQILPQPTALAKPSALRFRLCIDPGTRKMEAPRLVPIIYPGS